MSAEIKNYQILTIIEDEILTQRIHLSLREKNSLFDCIKAKSYEEGVDYIKTNHVDAILFDLDFAEKKGIDEFVNLYELNPDIPTLVLTDHDDDNLALQAIRKGAADYLVKGNQSPNFLKKTILFAMERHQLRTRLNFLNKQKDDFLAIVSHDLKTPLSIIHTGMELIKTSEDYRINNEVKDIVERSGRQAKFALELITDLLEVARIEGGVKLHMEEFNVKRLIEESVESLMPHIVEKRIKLNVHYEEDINIYADYSRMMQVVNNVLSNALKFSPNEGNLDIKVTAYSGRRLTDSSSRFLKIEIQDEGPGIPSDKLEKIFDKFQQAKDKDRHKGTGLGLTICKEICKLHKGNIWVEAVEGQGSKFLISIPHVLEEKKMSEGPHTFTNQTILVVDDDPTARFTLRKVLENIGFNVLEAVDGEDGLKKIYELKPQCLILDVEMPKLDGLSLLKKIRQDAEYRELPVIIYTSTSNRQFLEDYYRMAHDFISKPFETEELEFKVKSAMGINVPRIDTHKKTILYVVSDIKNALPHKDFIRKKGFNLLVTTSGKEALNLVKKYTVDLVITEIPVGKIDGIELAHSLESSSYQMPIVFLADKRKEYYQVIKKSFPNNIVLKEPLHNEQIEETLANYFKPAPKNLGFKILLVDDSEDMRLIFKTLLKKQNMEIIEAENGQLGFEEFKKNTFDFVFLDMEMPIMNGYATASKIRSFEKENNLTHTPIIAFTANTNKELDKALSSGCDSVLEKPLRKENLLQILDKNITKKAA